MNKYILFSKFDDFMHFFEIKVQIIGIDGIISMN